MLKGFEISETHIIGEEQEVGEDFSKGFHLALDKLLAQLQESDGKFVAGGSIHFKLKTSEGDSYTFRLMLQQIDEQDECAFCNGTGIEGS